ncbi:MAG: aromatic amino acid lyase [Burkholderiales bacterium]|nr:aromatic amino acid lyase [Burkholderiales bacterium]
MPAPLPIVVGNRRMSIEDVLAVARHRHPVVLASDAAYLHRIEAGARFLERLLNANGAIYGVNTGYGDSCTTPIPAALVDELPIHLTRYHRVGLGRYLGATETLAVMVSRLNSLAQGYSGARLVLLERLARLINDEVLPQIPEEGSVGASGDLTPLAYLAAAMIGEGEVRHAGRVQPAVDALRTLGLEPFALAPKEGLALMNGTSVMTALVCLAWARADYLSRLCCRLTAMAAAALCSNREHFDPRLFAVKPHAGQNEAAAWIHADLASRSPQEPDRLQDRYSIRCAPHVIGVLRDALGWMRRDVENELNSANDNPIIDPASESLLHGGHFYGGHIAFVADAMKTAVANLADLMDRQLALLVDTRYNNGLPLHLSGAREERAAVNHGLKAIQIGASAWTAEALKLTMPASVFSRSTECHNQDKVSMGTIAARDCLRVLELTEQTAAALALGVRQALALRARMQGEAAVPSALREFLAQLEGDIAFLDEDRSLDAELRLLVAQIQHRRWVVHA